MARILTMARSQIKQIVEREGAITVVTAVIVAVMLNGYLETRIELQDVRNRFLEAEIEKLDQEIAEIKRVRQRVAYILNGRDVYLKSRSDIPALLMDDVARNRTSGTVLRSVERKGSVIFISGISKSYSGLEAFIHRRESSNLVFSPRLDEVKRIAAPTNLPSYVIQFKVRYELQPAQ